MSIFRSQAKDLIDQAAALNGQTLTEFAVATLVEKARQVLHAESVRTLTERDARRFMRLLDEDQPNPVLRKAAKKYRDSHADVAD